jgi:octaprenyl-diphosphate synthase
VEEDYLRIIYNKTASLFEAACLSAALSVGASKEMEQAAIDYSYALGLAFQIQDDILDYSGTDSVGKPLGVDVLEQKITIPLLGALMNVSEQEQSRVRSLVNDIVGHPEHRDEIVTFVRENGGLDYSRIRLEEYVEQAVRALDVLPDSQEKEYLKALAYFTAKRDK